MTHAHITFVTQNKPGSSHLNLTCYTGCPYIPCIQKHSTRNSRIQAQWQINVMQQCTQNWFESLYLNLPAGRTRWLLGWLVTKGYTAHCVTSTIDEIKMLIIIEYPDYSQNVKQNTDWKCMSQEAFSGIKLMCSGRIQTHLQGDIFHCCGNILSYIRLQAGCPHTELPSDYQPSKTLHV